MSYLEPADVPYGAFHCPQCCQVRACEVAAGFSPSDPECAIECLTCGARIGEAIDRIERYPFPPVETRRSTLTPEEREAGRRRGRELVLGTFEPPTTGLPPKVLPKPPADFVARAAAQIASLRGRP